MKPFSAKRLKELRRRGKASQFEQRQLAEELARTRSQLFFANARLHGQRTRVLWDLEQVEEVTMDGDTYRTELRAQKVSVRCDDPRPLGEPHFARYDIDRRLMQTLRPEEVKPYVARALQNLAGQFGVRIFEQIATAPRKI